MYLAGEGVFFRHVRRLGSLLGRLTMATIAIATALVGLAVGYIAQLTLLVLLLKGRDRGDEPDGQEVSSFLWVAGNAAEVDALPHSVQTLVF